MAENTMPVAEAQGAEEQNPRYECAFHILPTVTEEEVPSVVDGIKSTIERLGGRITLEEAPQFLDLAYDIEKQIDGTNRRFNGAYFGWMRTALPAQAVAQLEDELRNNPQILRHLIVKLTRDAEENPFYFFAAREAAVFEEEAEARGADTEGEAPEDGAAEAPQKTEDADA